VHHKISGTKIDFWPEMNFSISILKIEKLKILVSNFFFKYIYGIEIYSRNRKIKLHYQTDFCSKHVSTNKETEK